MSKSSYFCVMYVAVAGIGLFQLIVYVSAPVALVKTILSLIHGYVACKNLSIIDEKERELAMKKEE